MKGQVPRIFPKLQMITANHLIKSFGHRKVLQDLSLSIDRGEIVALIGKNGSGKTTLIRILATLLKPDSGVISIDNEPMNGNAIQVRRKLGVVLHGPMLYPNLTARENLIFYGRLFSIQNLANRIEFILSEVDLTSRADDLVRTYSRGMQQRLSVARSILHDPDVLLLDEAYTGFDDYSSGKLDVLLKQKADDGKSILFTTHDLDRVFSVAKRVDILHKGKIAFSNLISNIDQLELIKTYKEITNRTMEILPFGAKK
jgi:heme exporter protein A